MKQLGKIVCFIFLTLQYTGVFSQNFPVRITPILTPPYTPFLTDYTDVGSDKLTLQVILNDLTINNYHCKLRLTIEGVNISITTNPDFIPAPLILQGGSPEILYGSDLSEYFNPNNLIYKGISKNDIEKNGNKLPEGIYRFAFEVVDYNRNVVVSNKGSAAAWMLLNDPPFINLPLNNAKVKPIDPQNIVFQWTPRHLGSPNSAFTTEYEVKLFEIWPKGRNPYDAVNTSQPIYELTTDATMTVYGPAETPLVLGREYALQIQAKDTGGKDLFKNNGYSEVVRFIYGDECPMPTELTADEITNIKARMKWQANGMNTGYLIRYREQSSRAEWFEENTNQSFFNLSGLRPATTYEYQLAGQCLSYNSTFTDQKTLTTLITNPNAFICGDPRALPIPDGSPPLPALMPNDSINAGGFTIYVTKATGTNGKFNGEGLAVIPWFNYAKVRITFDNITVNKSHQLTGGTINSVWDKDSKLLKVTEQLAKNDTVSTKFKADIASFEADSTVLVKGMIITVTADAGGNISVSTTDGSSVTLEKGKSYAIADEVGNGYLVDKEGNIKKVTAQEALEAGAKGEREYSKDPNRSVLFTKSDQTKYGLDAQRDGTLAQNYQQTENGKYIAWKALATGQNDFIQVIGEGTTDLSKVKFKREGVSSEELTANGQQLTPTGSANGTNEEILAIDNTSDTTKNGQILGKINLISYNPDVKNLVLVAVNNTTVTLTSDEVAAALNNIYGQAIVMWNVEGTIQKLTVANLDETKLDDGGSGLLSNYTGEMKQVINAYLNGNSPTNNTYYLFLASNALSGNKLGYMPRSKQAGFIFINAHLNNDQILHTMAHELGHGAFHLKHTFSEFPSLTEGSSDNLMDYSSGTALDKYQWDYIHNPEGVLGLFEDDAEGAYESSLFISEYVRQLRKAYQEDQSITLTNTHQISRPDEIRGAFYLMENQITYPEVLIDRHWANGKEITFKIGSFSNKYENDVMKGIDIRDAENNLVITIEWNVKVVDRDKYIQSLYQYLFWKPTEGNNLTVFVSGFDLAKHTAMIKCVAGDAYIAGPLALASAIGYTAANGKHFIQDLKETIISRNCQATNIDPYVYNYSISMVDETDYWGDIDDQFNYRIGSAQVVYAIGDNTINTAMDNAGFARRLEDGRKAGADLIRKINNGQILFYKDSKIDVVAHSMGFAFALGMIEELQANGYLIGWVYAIAPENPGAGYLPDNIEGIWQYGSQDKDSFYKQDGIAPQVAIPGIRDNQRVAIDKDAPQDFFNSHRIANYGWVFKLNKEGNVSSRKK